MKKLLPLLAALAFSCAAPVPAFAAGERVTGANIKAAILSDNPFSRGFVIGYIAGVFDSTLGIYHCTPSTVKEDDIIRLALDRLAKNDEPDKVDLLESVAAAFVARTFIDLYPCNRGAQPPSRPVGPRDGSRT